MPNQKKKLRFPTKILGISEQIEPAEFVGNVYVRREQLSEEGVNEMRRDLIQRVKRKKDIKFMQLKMVLAELYCNRLEESWSRQQLEDCLVTYIKEAGDSELDRIEDAVSNVEQDNLQEARHAFLKKTGDLTPEQFLERLQHTRFNDICVVSLLSDLNFKRRNKGLTLQCFKNWVFKGYCDADISSPTFLPKFNDTLLRTLSETLYKYQCNYKVEYPLYKDVRK
jgi:hypothetical protein